jgi:acyl carrier protein
MEITMNLSLDNKVENISNYLLYLCHENGIFPSEIELEHYDSSEDLIEQGIIDSMGLVYMQGIIHENFNLEIELELFIAELRNIQAIAIYLTQHLSTEWYQKNITIEQTSLQFVGECQC